MKPIAQEIRPAVDLAQLERRWFALEEHEQKTLAEIRLEKGRLLREARKAFPDTGRGTGWVKHLERWKVDERTARRYMALAGYVEGENSDKVSGFCEPSVPTYANAGIIKRPVTDADRDETWNREIEARKPDVFEVRQTKADRYLAWCQQLASAAFVRRPEGDHLSDVTTSPEQFERAKSLLCNVVRACLDELETAGVLDGKEKRRQLSLIDGGKK